MKTKQSRACARLACVLAAIGMAEPQTATESVLHNFVNAPQGANPTSAVVRDPGGNLYGTTLNGGAGGEGVVYRLDKTGHVKALYNFVGEAQQGPTGVVRDTAGNLYGSTQSAVYKLDTAGNFTALASPFLPSAVTLDRGGNLYWTTNMESFCTRQGCGGINRLDPAGQLTVLHRFSQEQVSPTSGVTLDGAGNLYGTAGGLLYKLDKEGQFTVLYAGGITGYPAGGVVVDPAGNLYGTGAAGIRSSPLLYRLDTAGNFTVLYNFTGGADGTMPNALVRDSQGSLYGTTSAGGTGDCYGGCGVVFKLDTAGNYTVLYRFMGLVDGGAPRAGVLLDPAGNLEGAAYQGGAENWGGVYRLDISGHETPLYSFRADLGAAPAGGLIGDAAGYLYGTTSSGGAGNQGVVYRLDGAGRYTVLYPFTGGADGGEPQAGVVRDSAGNLYGTTWQGGSAGNGVVFKLDPAGNETVLYNFTGGADGRSPFAGVILDEAGNLYGNSGVIFKLDTAGHFTVLHTFTGGTGGSYAYAGVIRDPAGNLYGTTAYGGNLNCSLFEEPGCGLVYRIDPAGNYTVLHAFAGGTDGASPNFAGVVRDSAGNLYGTTQFGGNMPGCTSCGTVFKLDASGQETVLHRFTGADGFQPEGVNLDPAGGLYGITLYGGNDHINCSYGCGAVFHQDAAGHLTVLYNFTGAADGSYPLPGLVRDPAGALFGTFGYGAGSSGFPVWIGGGVFKLKPQ
jgi:uncharacterized repeat protein (TIGR03803 family)